MSHYKHFTIDERENILAFMSEGLSVSEIARRLGRNKSSVSREINRNCVYKKCYRPSKAQDRYLKNRKRCRRHKKLENPVLKEKVRFLFEENQWSPEQIANRIGLECGRKIVSYSTIYRAIYCGLFNRGTRQAKVKLRHKGKRRRINGSEERRGKIVVKRELGERPPEANNRERIGDWEGDTVLGRRSRSCLATLVDRKSRYLLCKKCPDRKSHNIRDAIIHLLDWQPAYTVTPDRGKEFARYEEVEAAISVEFFFPKPGHPWERGTNENTNGLLREYFPKRSDIDIISDEEVQCAVDKINLRPRKILGWKTPFEVYHGVSLHLT